MEKSLHSLITIERKIHKFDVFCCKQFHRTKIIAKDVLSRIHLERERFQSSHRKVK